MAYGNSSAGVWKQSCCVVLYTRAEISFIIEHNVGTSGDNTVRNVRFARRYQALQERGQAAASCMERKPDPRHMDIMRKGRKEA